MIIVEPTKIAENNQRILQAIGEQQTQAGCQVFLCIGLDQFGQALTSSMVQKSEDVPELIKLLETLTGQLKEQLAKGIIDRRIANIG